MRCRRPSAAACGTHVALVADGVKPAVEVVHVARETVDKKIPRSGGKNCFGKQANGHFNRHDLAVFDEAGRQRGVGVREEGQLAKKRAEALVDHLTLL